MFYNNLSFFQNIFEIQLFLWIKRVGFYNHPERHVALLNLLQAELGDVAFRQNDTAAVHNATSSGNLTMNEMKECGRLVLITYNNPSYVLHGDEVNGSGYQLVWPTWRHFSTINVRPDDIHEYMRKAFTKKYEGAADDYEWTFFAVLGLENSYVIKHYFCFCYI